MRDVVDAHRSAGGCQLFHIPARMLFYRIKPEQGWLSTIYVPPNLKKRNAMRNKKAEMASTRKLLSILFNALSRANSRRQIPNSMHLAPDDAFDLQLLFTLRNVTFTKK